MRPNPRGVAVPFADGLAGPALGFDFEIVRAAVQEEAPVAVRVFFLEERDLGNSGPGLFRFESAGG